MALILNIETATQTCSVALCNEGIPVSVRESIENRDHASVLTVFISEILEEKHLSVSDIDAVSVSIGPGSYTGLRIGVSVAKGLCYAAGKPLIKIPTLKALAAGIVSKGLSVSVNTLIPMLDARRMEVYTGIYSRELKELLPVKAEVITETSFREWIEKGPVLFFGDGAPKCEQVIKNKNAVFINSFPASASYMGPLSELLFSESRFEDVAYLEPFYLKDFIATTPRNKVLPINE